MKLYMIGKVFVTKVFSKGNEKDVSLLIQLYSHLARKTESVSEKEREREP